MPISKYSTTMKPPSASSTSLSPPSSTYDLTICFRRVGISSSHGGRSDFISQLTEELSNIIELTRTFNNDGWEDIFEHYSENTVQDAIEKSRFLVIVLTQDCVKSITCLRELSRIMEYRSGDDGKEVIPVFYHDPSILVKELQDFGKLLEDYIEGKEETFSKCGSFKILNRTNRANTTGDLFKHNFDYVFSEEDNQKLLMEFPTWKSALERISTSPNTILLDESNSPHTIFEPKNSITSNMCESYMFESYMIKKVKEIIMENVKDPPKLIGISPQLYQMDKLLELGSNDIRFIGIVGMGGIGKTTLAKALYQELEPNFRYNHCFLRVDGQKLVSMQKKLLLRFCRKLDIVIKNEDHGAKLIKKCLRNRKVLIVLDSVDERRQIEKLAGSPDWFSPGSRIIITTRNRNLCRQPKYKRKIFEYNVECLDHDSAFSLFCNHAFEKDIQEPPNENFRDLTEKMVKLIEGHPLALTKIGSHLYGEDINTWEENFRNFDQLQYRYIFYDILEPSYYALDKDSQQAFLDLACLFNNNGMSVDRVVEILESLGYRSPDTKLHLLAERNLIKISYEMVQMHPLVRGMGREIVRAERETQSRIWHREDVRRVFQEESGLKHVKGIVIMDMEEEELVLEAKPFEYMTELKMLEINNNVKVDGNIQFLSNNLRFLKWNGYPSNSLPSTFEPQSLHELHLRNSKLVQLWEGKKVFIWLKEIDVSGSENLVKTPDFSKVPNLQRLILRSCERLCELHPSITTLNHLLLLDMANCVNLQTFPSKLITSKTLQTLILSNSGLESFPEIEKPTISLTELHLDGTLIHDLPMSLEHLTALTLLNLRDCTKLSSLPESIGRLMSLQTLNLNGCLNIHQIPSTLETIPSLTMLDIGRTLIDHAPNAITSFTNLDTLNCERLSRNIWRSLSGLIGNNGVLPIRDLNLSDCKLEDEDIPDDLNCLTLLEILDLSKNSFVKLKESLTQLTNLKALYLNDCNDIQPQLLPKFPTTLQYVGGLNSHDNISQNDEGSYGRKSASPPSSPPKTVTEIKSVVYEIEEEKSPEEVDSININKMEKQISQLHTHSKFEKVCGKELVGMEEQLEEVLKLVDLKESNEVRFVWICGMAGIGKTTIAEVVYNQIVGKFQSRCFLQISEKKNLVSLQHQLLSKLLLKDDIEIRDEDYGAKMIENEMKSRMALVVLDDIDEKRQVEVLVGSPDWFGHGSRVIITTRSREIIHQLNYKDKMREYNVKLLSQENANLLFCKYAFGNNGGQYMSELCTEIVKKVGRLPLALILIGSALRNKYGATWKEMLRNVCNVEEEFFNTIANKRNQKNCTMKLGNVQVKNRLSPSQTTLKRSVISPSKTTLKMRLSPSNTTEFMTSQDDIEDEITSQDDIEDEIITFPAIEEPTIGIIDDIEDEAITFYDIEDEAITF